MRLEAALIFALLMAFLLIFGGRGRRLFAVLEFSLCLAFSYSISSVFALNFNSLLLVSSCFAFALSFLEKAYFKPLIISAAAVAFLVPFEIDVFSASLAIGVLSRYTAEGLQKFIDERRGRQRFYSAYSKPPDMKIAEKEEAFEYRRKAIHFIGGLAVLSVPYILGIPSALALLSAGIILVFAAINESVAGNSAIRDYLLEYHPDEPSSG